MQSNVIKRPSIPSMTPKIQKEANKNYFKISNSKIVSERNTLEFNTSIFFNCPFQKGR